MHHDEKHQTNVSVEQLPNGDLKWTLPSGHSYLSEPENRYLGIHDLDPDDPRLNTLWNNHHNGA
jgi:hypothetical protein